MSYFLGTQWIFVLLFNTLHVVSSSPLDPQATDSKIESSVRIDDRGHSTLMRHHHRHKHKTEDLVKTKAAVDQENDLETRSSVADHGGVPEKERGHRNHDHHHASTHHAEAGKSHHHHHKALRMRQHGAVEFGAESDHLPSAEEKLDIKLQGKAKGQHDHNREKILPSSHATTSAGDSYSIANRHQLCEDGYTPIGDLLDCQNAMTAFGAEWESGEPCTGGPQGCSIRRDIQPVVSWVDQASSSDDTPLCNIICKSTNNSLLEIGSEPEGPSVSATCPDGYAREFGDSEPEWGDMVLGSYWGARHAETMDACAGQCDNVTDCMSFKWSPNFLQGAVPQHPCILTVNKHITTNSTFHDFIFCVKKSAETDENQGSAESHKESLEQSLEESGDAQEEFMYAQTGNDGLKRKMLKKDSRQDLTTREHERTSIMRTM